MSSPGTVNFRRLLVGLLVGALVLAVVVTAYAVGGRSTDAAATGQRLAPVAATTAPAEPQRTIVMTGRGKVTAVPDQLTFDVAVTVTQSDVAGALERANNVTRRVIRALQDQGIARHDLETAGLSVSPQYKYTDAGSVLVGYRAAERFDVLVRELKTGGEAISVAAEAGGNDVRISHVSLRVGNREALLAKARADAVKEATAKARQYTAAAGTSLGTVLSVREVFARQSGPIPLRATFDSAQSVAGQVPIRPGSQETSVTVSITWLLG